VGSLDRAVFNPTLLNGDQGKKRDDYGTDQNWPQGLPLLFGHGVLNRVTCGPRAGVNDFGLDDSLFDQWRILWPISHTEGRISCFQRKEVEEGFLRLLWFQSRNWFGKLRSSDLTLLPPTTTWGNIMDLPSRPWLDYDIVALTVLTLAIGILELLVLGIWLPAHSIHLSCQVPAYQNI
jgi:hypothetical protein